MLLKTQLHSKGVSIFSLSDRFLLRTKLKTLNPESIIGSSMSGSLHLSGLYGLNSTL